MAIILASVCTRAGKTLLSRQFRPVTKEHLHMLLSRFPKLAQTGSQHTTVEDEVRYLYVPIEELYVLVVTDLQSNILQDIKTLGILAKCVSAEAESTDEQDILDAAFAIIAAFDEVVSMGYSENLTLSQVETFLAMESNEERIQEIIERNKELEAAAERKKKAKELEDMRRKAVRATSDRYGDGHASPFLQTPTSAIAFDSRGPSSGPSGGPPGPPGSRFGDRRLSSSRRGGGLKLGRRKSSKDEVKPLLAELSHHEAEHAVASKDNSPVVALPEGTEVTLSEDLTIEATRDGSIRSSRVSGQLHLYAADRQHSRLSIQTTTDGPAGNYKASPNLDRALFAKSRTLGLKSQDREFPASNVLLVKWTLEDIKVPIIFNIWFSESQDVGFINVTIEYELDKDFKGTLENVVVTVPLPVPNAHVLDPSSVYDQFDDHLMWTVPLVNHMEGHGSGSFEFTAEADSEEDFLPMEVTFDAPQASSTFGQVKVTGVSNAQTGEPVTFNQVTEIKVDSYVIR